jgi:hypothetical protein
MTVLGQIVDRAVEWAAKTLDLAGIKHSLRDLPAAGAETYAEIEKATHAVGVRIGFGPAAAAAFFAAAAAAAASYGSIDDAAHNTDDAGRDAAYAAYAVYAANPSAATYMTYINYSREANDHAQWLLALTTKES